MSSLRTRADAAPSAQGKRSLFGWYMYDWANSAYITTAVGLLPVYFASVIAGPDGAEIFGRRFGADTLWGFTVGLAGFLSFLAAPVAGAIADFSSAKKKFLLTLAYTGAIFTMLLYTCTGGDVVKTMGFFLITQICFIGGNLFYDAFLPQIAPAGDLDRVSGRGYTYGYIGGGLQFLIALLLVSFHAQLGISQGLAARLGIALAGLWWGGFTVFTWKLLREHKVHVEFPERYRGLPTPLAYLGVGFSRTWQTARQVARLKHLLLFLLAFMFYNDGIQTVINMATTYGTVELKLPASALMGTLLVIQFVAGIGAWTFTRLAGRIGTKKSIMITLAIWAGITVYAYFMRTVAEFFTMGMLVGMVMGGSQSLSRSYYALMVPEEASAEFYGFYTVFTKFSSIWGPWLFAVVRELAGSARLAIVSLITFFIVGLVLLSLVDEAKAREAKQVFVI